MVAGTGFEPVTFETEEGEKWTLFMARGVKTIRANVISGFHNPEFLHQSVHTFENVTLETFALFWIAPRGGVRLRRKAWNEWGLCQFQDDGACPDRT